MVADGRRLLPELDQNWCESPAQIAEEADYL